MNWWFGFLSFPPQQIWNHEVEVFKILISWKFYLKNV